jgi:hypothetical protein
VAVDREHHNRSRHELLAHTLVEGDELVFGRSPATSNARRRQERDHP